MRIIGNTTNTANTAAGVPSLYDSSGKPRTEPVMTEGGMIGPRIEQDLLEISGTGRQLAADAIQMEPARYFGTIEIDETLRSVLQNKAPEVERAVYMIIQSNLVPDGSVTDEGERSALLEAGLSQARLLADHYMTQDESAKFMPAMQQIAAIANTRTVDPETGEATYATPPQKPKGAPDDYVNTAELMKRFEPDTYKKMREAVKNGGDWSQILIGFAMKVPQKPEWTRTYLEETKKQADALANAKIENRFAEAGTSSLDVFMQDMDRLIQQTSPEHFEALSRNLQAFARLWGTLPRQ